MSVSQPPVLSLIVPTYNESPNLEHLLNNVHTVLGDTPHEVIVVDDNSPDETWRLAAEWAKNHPWVKARRRYTRGLSSAVIEGFEIAQGTILGVMDADLSHDERILPRLIDAIQNGADLAVGSRRVPGGGAVHWPWFRRWASTLATQLAKHLLGLPLSDPMSGYFLLKRSLYESCRGRIEPSGYKILVEIYCKSLPARVIEIPYIFRNRREGHSKLSPTVVAQYMAMLWHLRSKNRPPSA
jgi:dolichol-phosphate mannosyltransferase